MSRTLATRAVHALRAGGITRDCLVNREDLGPLLAARGTDVRLADLNHDGIVNGADLGLLLANWT